MIKTTTILEEKLSLENAILQEKIEHLEEKLATYRYDFLTGFKLIKDFDDRFNEYFLEDRKFYLTLVDINGLHFINEEKGHLGGNAVIQKVARYLMDSCEGCLFRIGGDEFAILSINEPKCEDKDEFVYATQHSKGFKTSRAMFKATDALVKVAKDVYYSRTGKERRQKL